MAVSTCSMSKTQDPHPTNADNLCQEPFSPNEILLESVLVILRTLDEFFCQIIKLSVQITRWTQVWCNGTPSMRRMALCEMDLLITNTTSTIRMIDHELELAKCYLMVIKESRDTDFEDKHYNHRVEHFKKCIIKFETAVNAIGVHRDRIFRDRTRSVCIALESMAPEQVDHLLRSRNPSKLVDKAVERLMAQYDLWEIGAEGKHGKQQWINQWRTQSQNFELWEQYKTLRSEFQGMQAMARTIGFTQRALKQCDSLMLQKGLETIDEEEEEEQESPGKEEGTNKNSQRKEISDSNEESKRIRKLMEKETNRRLQVGTAAAVVLGMVGFGLGVLRR